MSYLSTYIRCHQRLKGYIKGNRGIKFWDAWIRYLGGEGEYVRAGYQDPGCVKSTPECLSVLEIGCGNGKVCEKLVEECFCEVTGMDVIPEGMYDRSGYAYVSHDITERWPFEDGSFDWVLGFDVLEHIEKEDIEGVVGEISRVGRNVIFSIPHRQARSPAPAGITSQNLHPLVRGREWWQDLLERGMGRGFKWKDPLPLDEMDKGESVTLFVGERYVLSPV